MAVLKRDGRKTETSTANERKCAGKILIISPEYPHIGIGIGIGICGTAMHAYVQEWSGHGRKQHREHLLKWGGKGCLQIK